MNRLHAIGVWLAVAIFLGGCVCCCGSIGPIGPSPDLTVEDVAGTYRGPDLATVTLNADGTFTAEHLDDCGPNHFGDLEGPESGSGTWKLGEPITLSPYQTLDLGFDPPESFSWMGWHAEPEEIYFFKGDPDVRDICFFNKQP